MAIAGIAGTKGFGRLDLMLALIIASLLAALAVPVYGEFANRAKVSRASEEVAALGRRIESYCKANEGRCPTSLDDLPGPVSRDPWGSRYHYVNLSFGDAADEPFRTGDDRKPLNTDFDLYSMGADQSTMSWLSASVSRDDVIRANNGVFVGLAEEY